VVDATYKWFLRCWLNEYMDESQVKAIVNANVEEMRRALQLQDWEIKFEYHCLGHGSDVTEAVCTPDPRYNRAVIVIDPARAENEEEVLKSLRHELLHCLIAAIETYRKAVGQLLDEKPFNAIDELFCDAVETTVRRLEQMLDHGLKKEEPNGGY